ncbi:hypothetical protein ABPG74_009548 [Tetrahymena malaccensis]
MIYQAEHIDQTHSSTVMRIQTEDSIEYALKIQTSSHQLAKEQDLKREYTILKNLQHENIISVGEYFEDLALDNFKDHSEVRGFTMELAQCDLLTYLKSNHPNPLHPAKARQVFSGIAKAVQYLHSKNIAHNDIKLENVLIFENGEAKLSDFGFACNTSSPFQAEQWRYRAPSFLAPEMIKYLSKKPSAASKDSNNQSTFDLTKTDSFAFGVCMFESLFFVLPFHSERAFENDTYYSYIVLKNYEGFWEIPFIKRLTNIYQRFFDSSEVRFTQLKDLLNKLLTRNPSERLSFNEILAHPWFSSMMDLSDDESSC